MTDERMPERLWLNMGNVGLFMDGDGQRPANGSEPCAEYVRADHSGACNTRKTGEYEDCNCQRRAAMDLLESLIAEEEAIASTPEVTP